MWKFHKGLKVILNINEIRRLLASSYIPLPEFLKNKNAIINPKNEDQKCLLWCVTINELLKTTPDLKHPERITKILKKKAESFNVKDINFPCGFSDIDKFEKNNNIAINLFGYNEEKNHEIFPLRVSKFDLEQQEKQTRVNILLITNENGDIGQRCKHYCLIKNMSRLFSSQLNKHKEKPHICYYCLQYGILLKIRMRKNCLSK